MISKQEVESKAQEFGIHAANVERDYVFGWLLTGIYTASPLRDVLILKGGNGFRKAYFENTRFSNDLDFSTQTAVDEAFLTAELNKVCDFVQTSTGVVFEKERNYVEEKALSDGSRKIYQAKLYFRDFYGNPETITISVRLDITEFDRIYLPVQVRQLIHPYSDSKECTATIQCMKLEEMLAGKLKCLLQRRYSFDLYDFVYAIFINRELAVERAEIVRTFLKKTIFEPSPGVVTGLLLGLPFQILKAAWDKYIVAPASSLIGFDVAVERFTASIHELFGGFPVGAGQVAYFPAGLRNPIIDAGSSLSLLAVSYDGIRRVVEPYSLVFKRRQDGFGQEYFYVFDRTGGRERGPGIKMFVHTKIEALEVLPEKFEPRFPVELAKAGEPGGKTYFGTPFGSSRRAGVRRGRSLYGLGRTGTTYIIECMYCGKRFKRKTAGTRLNDHVDKYGNKCFGRAGHLVDQYWG